MRFTLSTLAQPYIFAAFVYAGIILGVIFTVFRSIKRVFKNSKAVNILSEILCVLISGMFVVYVMYETVNLRLRFYYIFGLAAGFIIYSSAVFPLARAIRQKFTKKNVDNKDKNDCNNK